ncbi:MAG: cation-translocating P-type ATPase [Mycoplasmatales bacterium]|nr:cation-translocating P-type ATPase [Mycoplasmatales bacterium]
MKNKIKWFNLIFIGILFISYVIIRIIISSQSDGYYNDTAIEIVNNKYFWIIIATYVVFFPGISYFKVYDKRILKGKFNMDILVALAIHISYIFSVVVIFINSKDWMILEPIGLLYLFNGISTEIEALIVKKNSQEKFALETLKQKKVMLWDSKNKKTKSTKIQDIKIGDIVVFHAKEIIQFDGIVFNDEGMINNSNINGESTPQYVKSNSMVLSGTELISSMIKIKVTKSYEDSTLMKLIDSINKTNHSKPKMQTLADKFYKFFLPGVLIISILSLISWFLVGYLLNLDPLISSSSNHTFNAFLIMVSVLAISCPCAMTMAVPLVNYVSAQSYWKNNIIFNKEKDIEFINKTTDVVLDKTGTLTSEEMQIIKYFGNENYHQISAALEEKVYHPIATAIYKKFNENENIKFNSIQKNYQGVSGKISDKTYRISKISKEELESKFKNVNEIGTYVGLWENNILVAGYILRTEIKKNAIKLIKFFKSKNIKPILLSGDNELETKRVAKALNIDYKSEQSPKDKALYIKNLQKENKFVMMIGDGLNDAIAIKNANSSLSFASGSNITNSYSSASLISNDLRNVIYLFKLSSITKIFYALALFWSLIFNILLIPVAFTGLVLPWGAAAAMLASNLILYLVIYLLWKMSIKIEKNVFGSKTLKKVRASKNAVMKTHENTEHHCH